MGQDESFRFRPPSVASTSTSRRSSVRAHLWPVPRALNLSPCSIANRRPYRGLVRETECNVCKRCKLRFLLPRSVKLTSEGFSGQDDGVSNGRIRGQRIRRLRRRAADAPDCSVPGTALALRTIDRSSLRSTDPPVRSVVRIQGTILKIHKRYSAFAQLRHDLLSSYPQFRGLVPRLPPKSSLGVSRLASRCSDRVHALTCAHWDSQIPTVVPREEAATPRVLALDRIAASDPRRNCGRPRLGSRVE